MNGEKSERQNSKHGKGKKRALGARESLSFWEIAWGQFDFAIPLRFDYFYANIPSQSK
jgi:hypothetical protein